jgi:capsular polysaccharide biosynthesis protein
MNAPMDKPTNARLSQASIATTAVQAGRSGGAAPGQPPPEGAPDFMAMLQRVVAHWPVIALTLLVGGLVTIQVVRMRKATFKAETVIQFREGIGRSVSGPNVESTDMRSLGAKLKEVLLAQQNLRKIIDEFHLYPDVVERFGYAAAVDQMRKKTEFKSRSLDTFAIAYEGLEKQQAPKVANRMAQLLTDETAKRLREENQGTTEFLEAEKKRAEDELNRVEREMSEFLQAHPEFANTRDAIGVEALAIKNRLDEEEKRRRAKAALRGVRSPAPTPVVGEPRAPAVDPVLLQARSQAMTDLVAARKDLAEKSANFTDEHPDVRAAKERVASADAALRRAEDAIVQAAPKEEPRPKPPAGDEDPYGDATAKPKAPVAPPVPVATDPDEEKPKPKPKAKPGDGEQGDRITSLETEWAKLSRAHALAKNRQVDLENKLYNAEMLASTVVAGHGSSIVVIDPAIEPSGPSNAPPKTVGLMGLAASIAVGVVISAAWGLFLDDRLFSAGEVEGSVRAPVFGTVPRERRKEKGKDKDKRPTLPPRAPGGPNPDARGAPHA